MGRWPMLVAALATCACGQYRVRSIDLEDYSRAEVQLSDPATDPVVVQFGLAMPTGWEDGAPIYCDLLPSSTTASLNGLVPIQSVLGGIGEAGCLRPAFSFSLAALRASPEAPDAELVVTDGHHTIRMVVPGFTTPRSLVRITDVADAVPGAKVRYQWQPATDQDWFGDGALVFPDGTETKLFSAMVAGELVIDLPSSGWPAETGLDVCTSAGVQASVCEGAQACEGLHFIRKDELTLPAR
jgi:hypothetical protein